MLKIVLISAPECGTIVENVVPGTAEILGVLGVFGVPGAPAIVLINGFSGKSGAPERRHTTLV